ncbi:hypothetical protein Nepgr_024237 [Nepenthes gracilis]|uniref:Late embryogenesis abundant protein LEA-2 subgroup domain-containing protein n=1 Tax=Nepenthes gracilis TaxID=150966 RepID=A0AAD3XZV0_NEPGR|nr:hypothetical protein Nepgr_024237 [Nepenthes gracilis]
MEGELQPQEETHYQHHKMTGDRHPDHHQIQNGARYRSRKHRILAFLTIFLLLAGTAALIAYLIYHPEKPKFTVVSAAVYTLNTTARPFIETTMQFTLLTRNPNRRVSLSYDRLSATVYYRNQAITPPMELPPLHQDRKSTVALSPVVGGEMVPVSAEVMEGVAADEQRGVMGLRLVLMGRMRFKAEAITTGHFGVFVTCDMSVGLKKGYFGQVTLFGSPRCSVDI